MPCRTPTHGRHSAGLPTPLSPSLNRWPFEGSKNNPVTTEEHCPCRTTACPAAGLRPTSLPDPQLPAWHLSPLAVPVVCCSLHLPVHPTCPRACQMTPSIRACLGGSAGCSGAHNTHFAHIKHSSTHNNSQALLRSASYALGSHHAKHCVGTGTNVCMNPDDQAPNESVQHQTSVTTCVSYKGTLQLALTSAERSGNCNDCFQLVAEPMNSTAVRTAEAMLEDEDLHGLP